MLMVPTIGKCWEDRGGEKAMIAGLETLELTRHVRCLEVRVRPELFCGAGETMHHQGSH